MACFGVDLNYFGQGTCEESIGQITQGKARKACKNQMA